MGAPQPPQGFPEAPPSYEASMGQQPGKKWFIKLYH